MKVEMQTAHSDASTKSKVIREVWVYLPTYLEDDQGPEPSGELSLFVRRFRLYVTPKGTLSMRRLNDVEMYLNEDAMYEAIKEREMVAAPGDELPADWYPAGFEDVLEPAS